MADTTWDLSPGDTIERKALHEEYGGKPQGGISPSRSSPNIFLFTGVAGHQYGYADRWVSIGDRKRFLYIGEGQEGDQHFTHGNRQILNHQEDGRALRLFMGSGGEVRYVAVCALDEEKPWVPVYGPDREGAARQMLGFLLEPLEPVADEAVEDLSAGVTRADVDSVFVAAYESDMPGETSKRGETLSKHLREAELVDRYRTWLRTQGRKPVRLRIVPAAGEMPMFTDVYEDRDKELVEAKGAMTRQDIYMAIGQILHYRQHIADIDKSSILLPQRPNDEMIKLLGQQGIDFIYETDEGFNSEGGPRTRPRT